jgi:hypothetical protein
MFIDRLAPQTLDLNDQTRNVVARGRTGEVCLRNQEVVSTKAHSLTEARQLQRRRKRFAPTRQFISSREDSLRVPQSARKHRLDRRQCSEVTRGLGSGLDEVARLALNRVASLIFRLLSPSQLVLDTDNLSLLVIGVFGMG